jgi:hypothetical protein
VGTGFPLGTNAGVPGDPWLAKAAEKLVIEIDNEVANLL